jgi:7-carboxy-7-deazaguanine synthase
VYSFKDGPVQSIDEILSKVDSMGIRLVELTGGEPLAQAAAFPLITTLANNGFQVLIETSGSECIRDVDQRAHIIMDIKCPGSGMSDRNRYENIEYLKQSDEIKFVISNREDFDWMVSTVREFGLETRCRLLISPAWGLVKPDQLVNWLIDSKINARLNLQIHKYIWGPRAKGV